MILVKGNLSLLNVLKSLLSAFEAAQESFHCPLCCWSWPLRSHSIHVSISLPGGLPRRCIHLPVQEMQEMWVQSLGQEDPLEKEMATCSSIILA